MNIEIKHDGLLEIAVGRSRKEISWKNKEFQWSDLVKKLSVTHRTAETFSEYLASKKPRQDEIKDIGGFVGGRLNNGRRKPENVACRCFLSFDADDSHMGFWDDFCMLFSIAGVMYSTHKHCTDNPRMRLIIPLDRPVLSDEYVAIARKIAGILGIDYFDDTTFQPERLMYWPSTSKDGEYLFEYQDGPWLSADETLASYHDWKDSSEWPVSSRVDKILERNIQKQGDPLEKPGVVGAFCRVYSISEAIEAYLPETYESCDIDNRYTFKEGSTSGGLVVYEDKFAYSHHGTDPISGKLCNAFDLVRLHKFGLKDEDAREGTPSIKLPSYLEMLDFATKDKKVRRQIGEEKLNEAMGDFKADLSNTEGSEPVNSDWLEQMDYDKKGKLYSTINNAINIITNDPMLKGCIAMNVFEQREIALRNLPWRKVTEKTKYLTDKDDAGLRHYLENTYEISGVQKVQDAVDVALLKNSFHPVKDYLTKLYWDGLNRIDTVLIDYLGAKDTQYVRAVTRKALVAAVARIISPGSKFDYVLTLVGKQGVGKSTIIKKLGKQWYSDSFTTIQGKESFEQIQGVWLVEIGELAGLKKAEMETIKHFISKQEDRYRVAYGRRTDNFPRQCVFFGTTNNRDFLRDPTGNRRFWPVDTMENEPALDLFTELTDEVIDQIWAEAVELYSKGEALYLSRELEEIALGEQQDHSEQDERAGLIQKYLDTLLPSNWDEMDNFERRAYLNGNDELQANGTVRRNRVCIPEIWCELFGGTQKDMTRFNVNDLHTIMRKMEGWNEYKSRTIFKIYGNQKGYFRANSRFKNTTDDDFSEENTTDDDFL